MKIAVIADIHCNHISLEAVLESLVAERPDSIACAGDSVGCSAYAAGARRVWRVLQEQRIPCVLGNEETRILDFHSVTPDPYLATSVQFMPLQYLARQFSAADIATMRSLPVDLLIEGPAGQNVLVCHGSPGDVWRSPLQGMDAAMEQRLAAAPASVIAVGHLHTRWHQHWQGKLLVMAGSAGLPLRGNLDEVEVLLLTFRRQGGWQFEYQTVKYDAQTAIAEAIASPFLQQAGPIGWLMLDEILTQQDRMIPFLRDYCPAQKPDDRAGWEGLVTGYLQHLGRWDAVKMLLP